MSDQSYWHLRATLRDLVTRHGSIGAAAKALGIHRPDLSRALAGQPPRPSVLRAIGWEAVTTYRPVQGPRPEDTQAQLRDIAARIQALLAVDNPPTNA